MSYQILALAVPAIYYSFVSVLIDLFHNLVGFLKIVSLQCNLYQLAAILVIIESLILDFIQK